MQLDVAQHSHKMRETSSWALKLPAPSHYLRLQALLKNKQCRSRVEMFSLAKHDFLVVRGERKMESFHPIAVSYKASVVQCTRHHEATARAQ